MDIFHGITCATKPKTSVGFAAIAENTKNQSNTMIYKGCGHTRCATFSEDDMLGAQGFDPVFTIENETQATNAILAGIKWLIRQTIKEKKNPHT